MRPLLIAMGCCIIVFLAGWSDFPPGRILTIRFINKMGNRDLVLGNTYQSSAGEAVTIRKFKYYISNISFTDKKGNTIQQPSGYFLVDESDTASKSISLKIPNTTLTSIHFLIGVDSIRNISGTQTGALDPLNGMFWTWNSGYIMAKLEGNSPSSAAPLQQFTYHIGGFKKGSNTVRMIELVLPQPVSATREIAIAADADAWFKGRHLVTVAATPVCHSPGELAMKIADNYSTMFTILSCR
ncbi:MAG: hypothetical protein NVSMB63_16100 [Sediminibacterium sp.]